MDLGFRGEVADFYDRYRRGYPRAVIDTVVDGLRLTGDDIVIDLGCGTGQLTLAMASRVRAVLGVDPEPDMVLRARRRAESAGVRNASWAIGSDAEIGALAALLGHRSVGAVTIAQALHWMSPETLFPALSTLVRPGGGVAVVTNGEPLWLQRRPWSQALRDWLENWLGTVLTKSCGTDEAAQRRYRQALAGAGFAVRETVLSYRDVLTVEQIIGGVYSALPVDRLPDPAERNDLANELAEILVPHAPFEEDVRVTVLAGRTGASS
jgi:ubiquinone/menaquinone biosynthesis C-methylase UbiE